MHCTDSSMTDSKATFPEKIREQVEDPDVA